MKYCNYIREVKWALLSAIILIVSSCAVSKPTIHENQVAGVYSAVTDFSREVQNMNGAKETMVYKKGREEKLKFMADHKFIKTIHYSSDRVADQIVMGQWELSEDNKLLHAFSNETMSAFSEYYQLEGPAGNLIRLDENKQKLAPEYAPFYTYYRQTTANLAGESK